MPLRAGNPDPGEERHQTGSEPSLDTAPSSPGRRTWCLQTAGAQTQRERRAVSPSQPGGPNQGLWRPAPSLDSLPGSIQRPLLPRLILESGESAVAHAPSLSPAWLLCFAPAAPSHTSSVCHVFWRVSGGGQGAECKSWHVGNFSALPALPSPTGKVLPQI